MQIFVQAPSYAPLKPAPSGRHWCLEAVCFTAEHKATFLRSRQVETSADRFALAEFGYCAAALLLTFGRCASLLSGSTRLLPDIHTYIHTTHAVPRVGIRSVCVFLGAVTSLLPPDLEQHHGVVHDNILQSLNRASALANRRRPAKELDPAFFALNQLRLARVVWSRAFHHTDKVEHKLMVTIEHTINYPKIVALMLRQL